MRNVSSKKLFRNNPTYLHGHLCNFHTLSGLHGFQMQCEPTLNLHSSYTRSVGLVQDECRFEVYLKTLQVFVSQQIVRVTMQVCRIIAKKFFQTRISRFQYFFLPSFGYRCKSVVIPFQSRCKSVPQNRRKMGFTWDLYRTYSGVAFP